MHTQLCCRAFNLVVLSSSCSSSSLLLRCLNSLPLLSHQNQGNINTGNASGPLALSRQSLWLFARAPKGMNDSILHHCTENTHTCLASILCSVLLRPSALSLVEFRRCLTVTVPRLPPFFDSRLDPRFNSYLLNRLQMGFCIKQNREWLILPDHLFIYRLISDMNSLNNPQCQFVK